MRTCYGVGINDATYQTNVKIGGKNVKCPFLMVWQSMMSRCYNPKNNELNPSYLGCVVDDRWIRFMSFREWMIDQDWVGNQLDKDLLIQGNKVYGPDTCLFVTREVNGFLVDSNRTRGDYPIGVSWHKTFNKFVSQIGGKDRRTIGYFDTSSAAHLAWRKEKHIRAVELSSRQSDPRVVKALLERFPDPT